MSAFSSEHREGPEGAESGGNVAVLDPIEDLSDFRRVIEDKKVYEDALAHCAPPQQKLLTSMIALAEQLCELTDWSRDRLLDQLGCEHRDLNELGQLKVAKLRRCEQFLTLARDTAELVQTVPDHRAVVIQCARLLKATGQDVERLTETLGEGEFSARDYIRLGEISAAARTARAMAGVSALDTAAGPSPFDGAPLVHLSPTRVDLYVREQRERLGTGVYESIDEHIRSCSGCHDAVEFRRARVQVG